MSRSPARNAANRIANEFSHLTFHELAGGADVRVQLGTLFFDGFALGAQLALVDPTVARDLVEELAPDPAFILAIAAYVEQIRSAR